jgi:hypothetical protein
VPPQTILFGKITAGFDDDMALLKMKQIGNKKIATAIAAVASLQHVPQTLNELPFFCSGTPALSNCARKSRLAEIATAIPFCPIDRKRSFSSPQLGQRSLDETDSSFESTEPPLASSILSPRAPSLLDML